MKMIKFDIFLLKQLKFFINILNLYNFLYIIKTVKIKISNSKKLSRHVIIINKIRFIMNLNYFKLI